jgi:hypothetical protein
MKTNRLFQLLTMSICAIAFAFVTGCEGPEGPPGPAGPQGDQGLQGPAGTNGTNGTDGTDGVSGSAECLACHSSDAKYRVTMEYEQSVHATGSTAARGSSGSCAPCHSNEGFIETQWTGELTSTGFNFPTRISCTTCHAWHNESFDLATESPDYALRTTAPVDLYMFRIADLPSQTIDLDGAANLCVNCHQPRVSWDGVKASSSNLGDGTYDQQNTHFGPHHGPQSASLMMIGAADDIGTTATPTEGHVHARIATCISCHMNGDEADHTFDAKVEACNKCHSANPLTTVDENPRQVAVNAKIQELEDALVTAGLLAAGVDSDGNPTISEVKGVFPLESVGALFNYLWVEDDRSAGVHNFAYIEALLDKSLEAMN